MDSTSIDKQKYLFEMQKELGKEYTVPDDHWDEYVGQLFFSEACKDAIRHYADAIWNRNPIHRDEHYAAKTRDGRIVAPPTFLYAVHAGYRLCYYPSIPGCFVLYTGAEWEWFLPIFVGDKFTVRIKLVDAREKYGEFAGSLIAGTQETKYFNQKGQLIATHRSSLMRGSREEALKRKKYTQDTTPQDAEKPKIFVSWFDAAKAQDDFRRGATPLYFEDVQVESDIPSLPLPTLKVEDMVRYYGAFVGPRLPELRERDAVGTTNAPGRGHYDASYNIGFNGQYDVGPQRVSWFANYLTDWIGDDGFLKKLSAQVRIPNIVGDTTTCKGHIINKYIENNQHLIEVKLRAENQRGENIMVGQGTVVLPSRS